MDFVGGVGVPNDELSVLRSRYKVATVSSPVHGVNLGQMTPESASRAHDNTGQSVNFSGHGAHYGSGQLCSSIKSRLRIRTAGIG